MLFPYRTPSQADDAPARRALPRYKQLIRAERRPLDGSQKAVDEAVFNDLREFFAAWESWRAARLERAGFGVGETDAEVEKVDAEFMLHYANELATKGVALARLPRGGKLPQEADFREFVHERHRGRGAPAMQSYNEFRAAFFVSFAFNVSPQIMAALDPDPPPPPRTAWGYLDGVDSWVDYKETFHYGQNYRAFVQEDPRFGALSEVEFPKDGSSPVDAGGTLLRTPEQLAKYVDPGDVARCVALLWGARKATDQEMSDALVLAEHGDDTSAKRLAFVAPHAGGRRGGGHNV